MNSTSTESPRRPSLLKRLVKACVFLALLTITLVLVVFAWINFTGEREWSALKRELEAKGEKLTLAEMIPPTVPSDQNFAQTPLLAPLLDYDPQVSGEKRWRDFPAYQRIATDASLSTTSKDDNTKRKSPPVGQWRLGQVTDLVEWQDFYRENPKYPHPTKEGSPAKDVLLALSRDNQDMDELRLAAKRPHSRFNVHYETENAMMILLPHLAVGKRISTYTQLRSIAFLADGKPAEAIEDLEVAFKFMEGMRKEPVLISYLVDVACWQILSQSIYEGLSRHQWDGASLDRLKSAVEKIDFLEGGAHALRGERAFGNSMYERWIGSPSAAGADLTETGDPGSSGGSAGQGIIGLAKIFPRGVFRWNQVGQNRYTSLMVETFQGLEGKTVAGTPLDADALTKQLHTYLQPASYKNFLVRMLAPALDKTIDKGIQAETTRRLALIAIALEQHRLSVGDYPESLEGLTPKWMSRLWRDPMSAQPFHYKREGKGRFMLYGLGWNATDDGGAWPAAVRDLERKPSTTAGTDDVVWRYPASE